QVRWIPHHCSQKDVQHEPADDEPERNCDKSQENDCPSVRSLSTSTHDAAPRQQRGHFYRRNYKYKEEKAAHFQKVCRERITRGNPPVQSTSTEPALSGGNA